MRGDLTLVVLDAVFIASTYLVLFLARFEFAPPTRYWTEFWMFLPTAVVVTIVANALWGAYGRTWEHASIDDARRVVLASMSSGAVLLVVFSTRNPNVPTLVLITGPVV